MASRHLRIFSCAALVVTLGFPGTAAAQNGSDGGARVEALVTVGWGRLWQWESNLPVRSGVNVGGAVIIRSDSGVGFSLGADRTLGHVAAPTAFSANLRYYFRSDERVQPYLIAGLGVLRLNRRGVPLAGGRPGTIDYGVGPNLGAGVAIVDDKLVVAVPEFQWLEGAWLSPLNMSTTRVVGGIGTKF